jgi:beta-1,4-mannosyl-glycoprotein beta-1,4-N-acetylglucosaminyltransferase
MKIFDCFTFFNELDLLEIRLTELYDVVDYFVIIEADKTQTGKPKEYYFEKNKTRFIRYKDKIIHFKINMPETNNFWIMENYQRNQILRGLINCKKNDIILISDLDEIPNPKQFNEIKLLLNKQITPFQKVKNIINELNFNVLSILNGPNLSFKNKILRKLMKINDFLFNNSNIIVCNQKQYYYYLNYLKPDKWTGTRAIKYNYLINKLKFPQNIRYRFYGSNIFSGWHFSYLGNWDKLKTKVEAYADSERIKKKLTSNDYKLTIKNGRNIITGKSYKLIKTKIDSSYPESILNNVKKYKKYII